MRSTITATALAASIALAILQAAPILKVTIVTVANPSPQGGGRFAESVSSIGDVNGDGVGDLLVGAPGQDRVYVISGATRAPIRTIVDPDGLTGNRFGFAVGAISDVNGDNIEDVLVGAPGPFPSPLPLPCVVEPCPPPDPAWGRAFVISGSSGALIHKITPVTDFLGFGVSIAALGDVNGDGVADVAVGMVPFGLASAFGRVYAFSGANKALLWSTQEPGGKQLASFGMRIASIADLTGDDRRDLLASAPLHDVDPNPNTTLIAGEAYVLSGSTGAVVRTNANPAPASDDRFGLGLAAVGDQTGDGIEDYVIGEAGPGLVHLINGSTGASAGTIASPDTGDLFGFAITSAGDQDADGRADFWIGAPQKRKVHLRNWFGSALATVADSGGGPDLSFGFSVARTANLGGDLTPDLLVGSPGQASDAGLAFIVMLAMNKPPVANAGTDQIVECAGPSGAAVVLNGSASTDPDGDSLTYEWKNASSVVVGTSAIVPLTLPIGTHTFVLTVSDGFESNSDSVTVTVQDTTPPVLTVGLDPAQLWPPDHRMIPIAASINATDVCDASPSVMLVSITSNESDDANGDGHTTGDIQQAAAGTDDRAFLLRAEREGGGAGRRYEVTYTASDASGNASTAAAVVTVPHSKRP
jgi:hypothetical protein